MQPDIFEGLDEDDTCTICLDRIDLQTSSYSCTRHAFHDACIESWVQAQARPPGQAATCPICRDPIEGSTAVVEVAQDVPAAPPPGQNDCRKLCTLWTWVVSIMFALGWSSYMHSEPVVYIGGLALSFATAGAVLMRRDVRITAGCCVAFTLWVYVRCVSGESKNGVCADPQGTYWLDLNVIWWSFLFLTSPPHHRGE